MVGLVPIWCDRNLVDKVLSVSRGESFIKNRVGRSSASILIWALSPYVGRLVVAESDMSSSSLRSRAFRSVDGPSLLFLSTSEAASRLQSAARALCEPSGAPSSR